MISFIIFLVFLLGSAGWFLRKRKAIIHTRNVQEGGVTRTIREFRLKPALPIIGTLVIGIILSLVQPYVVDRVDAGYVGVKVNLTGNERGTSDVKYATGWVLFNTWTEELYQFPTFQQHIEYEDQQVILKGGFATVIRPTFNYALKADMVTDMFSELRLTIREIEQGWLKTAIISSVNDVSNQWEVDQIFNNREKFENEIIAECNERVGKWFDVSLLRTNIVPPPSIQDAIEAEVKAIKERQAKEQQVLVTIANGEIMIAQARADSAQAVILAQGEANAMLIKANAESEAIKILQAQLTDEYNEYIRSSSWNGVYPTTVAGNGSGILLDARQN